MMTKENARPASSTAGAGRDENAAFGEAAFSKFYFTTSGPNRQRIFPLLGHGKSSTVTGRELAERMGMGDLRELTRLVEQERAAGIPVCATCDSQNPGYYLASEPGELAAYIKSLDRRLHNVRRTRDRLADTLTGMTGQTAIWKWGD